MIVTSVEDVPTEYNQRFTLFYKDGRDDYLSDGNVLEELSKFLWEDQSERMDNYLTDLIPDEEDICDLEIKT
jgi:hypothetical protein